MQECAAPTETNTSSGDRLEPTWSERVIHAGEAVALPELLREPMLRKALYTCLDRHGVSTVAYRTRDLSRKQVREILTFRLACYLRVGMANAEYIEQEGLAHEPLDSVLADDIQILSLEAVSNQIIACASLNSARSTHGSQPLSSRERWTFAFEQVHGSDLFNVLEGIEQVTMADVYEMNRFMKRRGGLSRHAMMRGPIEVCVAAFRIFTSDDLPKRQIVVGEIEEGAALSNFAFFQVPITVLSWTLPVSPAFTFLPDQPERHFMPYAFHIADLQAQVERLSSIEHCLTLTGEDFWQALKGLRQTSVIEPGRLHPSLRNPLWAQLDLRARKGSIQYQRRLVTLARWLRRLDALAPLLGEALSRTFAMLLQPRVLRREEWIETDELCIVGSGALLRVGHSKECREKAVLAGTVIVPASGRQAMFRALTDSLVYQIPLEIAHVVIPDLALT